MLTCPIPAVAQAPYPTESTSVSYADTADVLSVAKLVAIATITKASPLRGLLAEGVPSGQTRFLIVAEVEALLAGDNGIPARIEYLVDIPLDRANHPIKLRKSRVIIAASPVAERAGMVRLVGPRAQMDWSAPLEARTRAILTEVVAPDAPPRIIGVGNLFHVRGSLPGESETQIFLKTADGSPVSLSVLRRPGEDTRWAVALGEMVDDSARPPARDTLLWYRLACSLPATLPMESLASLNDQDALAANADYRFVIESLGRCRGEPAH